MKLVKMKGKHPSNSVYKEQLGVVEYAHKDLEPVSGKWQTFPISYKFIVPGFNFTLTDMGRNTLLQ